jgi:Ca2+-binding RTX toxin-like protein
MTTYLLTTGDDKITGTSGTDTFDEVFDGAPGGIDMLNGAAGNDTFLLYGTGSGTIDGGAGTDSVVLYDSFGSRVYKNVEILDIQSYINIYEVSGTIDQFSSFNAIIDSTRDISKFYLSLTGVGGEIDFSALMEASDSVHIESRDLKSGVTVVGTAGQDYIAGSNFNDILEGGDGDDHLEAGKGIDTLLGGAGNDKLTISEEHGQGIIDGGEGVDTVFTSNFFIDDFSFANVETLLIDGRESISATVKSLSAFTSIEGYWEPWLGFYLAGEGGSIDFSTRVVGRSIVVDDYGVTSGYTVVATSKNDSLTGSGFDDSFEGGGGSDTIDGGVGIDTAAYTRSKSGVTVNLTTNVNTGGDAEDDALTNIENLTGSDFADSLTGDQNANRLSGGAGNDTLAGGSSADQLSGGDGVDTASYADAVTSIIASLANPSINTGDAAGDTYVSVENLTGSAFKDALNGDNSANTIIGDAGDDTIKGYGGDDKLFGGDGNDTLLGGIGADYLSGGTGLDTASYANATEGVYASVRNPWENQGGALGDTYNSIENLTGSNFDDILDGNSSSNVLIGGKGNDSLGTGFSGRDELYGGDGDDILFTVNDDYLRGVFDGGAGVDTLKSEYANLVGRTIVGVENLSVDGKVIATIDILSKFQQISGSDIDGIVIELEGAGGILDLSNSALDSIYIQRSDTTSGFTLIGGAYADHLKGSAFNDVLQGGAGADSIGGGAGLDTVSYSLSKSGVVVDLSVGDQVKGTGDAKGDFLNGIENAVGSDFADSLTGDKGNNKLLGGEGNDLLSGGAGADYLSGGSGADRATYAGATTGVIASLTNPSLNAGEAKGDTFNSIENLEGSAFNDTLDGSAGANTLAGQGGNDVISGLAGDDKLSGNDGSDILIGGLGADYLSGGTGSDAASYAQATASVKVNLTDPSLNTGEARGDTFNSIENLEGSAFNDALDGSAGANTLAGQGGNDVISGHAGDDKLSGNDGNDVLSGGLGADYLSGGAGSDTASYAQAAAAVKVDLTDPSLNTGEARGDTFNSIENLEGSAFNDTLDGNAGANILTGLGGIDVLRGAAGNDTLLGGDGDDKLGGGDGNDVLAGGTGADYLNGGLGADTTSYAGAAAGVIVNLAVPAGNTGEAAGDTFTSIENLEGSGFSDRLTGDAAKNAISGLNGTDVIDGGAGSDALAGGAGKDFFVFTTVLGASNVDTIADFSAADDTIRLDNAIFSALGATGALLSGYFRANTTGTAQDTDDHIIYETDTGKLFYDADANGAGAAIQFATLTGLPTITAADFQVV